MTRPRLAKRLPALCLLVLAFGACYIPYLTEPEPGNNDANNGSGSIPDTPVTGVSLNKSSADIYIAITETLSAAILPNDATNKNLTWSSSNEDVVNVTNGRVTAIAAGTAAVTVTTVDGGKTATCTFTVTVPSLTSSAQLKDYLSKVPSNSAANPYVVEMNLISLPSFTDSDFSDKYVRLDLSGSTIARIENEAFHLCQSVVDVTIPNSVTSIGNYAFSLCTSLTSVTIPNSVTSIEMGAFRACFSLTGITIPNSVTNIGNTSFYNCSGLTDITIPNSVTNIGDYAFHLCTSLASVTFEGTIPSENFAYNAFGNNSGLRAEYFAGGSGTYTTTAPVSDSSVWTKQ